MNISRGRRRRYGFNPFAAGFADDPYVHWAALREFDPVHRSPLGYWILTRYDDIAQFTRLPSLAVEEHNADPVLRNRIERLVGNDTFARRAILYIDPPDHTRLRRLISAPFAPRAVQRLSDRIVELCDASLDRIAKRGEAELIEDYAFPISFTMISEILGMPAGDHSELRRWASILVGRLELLTGSSTDGPLADAGRDMTAYLEDVVAWKRGYPADDLLTALIAAEQQRLLSPGELVDQVSLLYVAGHETSLNLIGNGTLALLRHRRELERLIADPVLDRVAVDELLRFDPPVQLSRRITLSDSELAEQTIPAGSLVACILASANRDQERWGEDADTVRLDRDNPHEHLSFGGGAHYCLGAALARMEGQVAIARLVRRFPKLELRGTPTWKPRVTLRGLKRLDLALG